jgi:hypothetical protein
MDCPPHSPGDAVRGKKLARPRTQRQRAAVSVIAVEEGKEIEPIVREHLEASVEVVKLIEIDQEPEQAVAKPVRLGC